MRHTSFLGLIVAAAGLSHAACSNSSNKDAGAGGDGPGGGTIALTAQADTHTTAKWDGLLGARDLAAIQVTDFDMVDGGTRIQLTLDCVRTAM